MCLIPLGMAASIPAKNPHPTFRRDRRAIQARLAASAEDHITHAAMKLKMMNEGRARRAVNPTRVKRFISPAAGVLPHKASQGYPAYAQYESVPSSSGRAVDIVNRIQHGANPPQTGSNQLSDKIFQDLLLRQRKDDRQGKPAERPTHTSENQKPSNRERDDFMRLMQELGVMEVLENDFEKSQKASNEQDDKGKASSYSAAKFVSQRLHRPSQHDDTNPSPQNRDDGKSDFSESRKFSAASYVNHRMSRPSPGDVTVKRDFPLAGDDDLGADLDDVKEEAVINIRPKAMSKSNEGKLTLSSVDLEVIRNLLEEIVAKHHHQK